MMRAFGRLSLIALAMATSQAMAAGLSGSTPPAAPPDLSGYATSSDLAAATSALQSSMAAAATKQSTIPSAGPGAGQCKQTIVPSELVTSGGMTGTAGTCSRILQCGTSPSYVVTQFNVGSGC